MPSTVLAAGHIIVRKITDSALMDKDLCLIQFT